MPDTQGSAEAAPSTSGRKLLVAVDDSAECERALAWALGELYRHVVWGCSDAFSGGVHQRQRASACSVWGVDYVRPAQQSVVDKSDVA